MGNKTFVIALFIAIYFGLCQPLYAWNKTYTHPALSQEAANISQIGTYLQGQLGYTAGLNTQLQITGTTTPYVQDLIYRGMDQSVTTRSILGWMREGSKLEDAKLYQARSQHHFHDPIRNTGLDNRTDYPDWEGAPTGYPYYFDLRGESALFWITTGTSSTGYPKNNLDTWEEARIRFYESLRSSSASVREQYMAETFLALGHILHMIEDMGVPAHTRNDWLFGHYRAFYDFGNPFESWVEDQVKANGGQSPWSGIGPAVFDKLAKYFDANEYVGDYLGDGETPPEGVWGLAECSNYQFLSFSTVFGCSGVKYQFPHPAKEHTSSLTEGNKVYFNGTNYGVVHLARDSYTRYKAGRYGEYWPVIDRTTTTDDEKVFTDYADITIPRTIDYAAGLVNYFFRGQLTVEPNWADPNIVELVITNDSNNSGIPQTLLGGTFEIYWDDANDARAKIDPNYIIFTPEWTPAGALPNDGGLTELSAQFAPPAEKVKKYVVVYKGDISENPADPDPDDTNAIAVGILRGGYEVFTWSDEPDIGDKYGQVSDAPEGADFIDIAAGKRHCLALRTDGSIEAWGRDNYGQVSNKPGGNDFIAIAAGTNHSLALKSDGSIVVWGDDGLWQITDKPSGNDFVAITAGDYHSLALKSDGTIVGWGGYNTYGECDAPAPDTGTVYTAIAAGSYHSLALQSDGTVKAWGNNNQGQTRIYDGAEDDHEAAAACANYSFLLRDDGMLIAWGGGDWLEPGIPRYHYRQPDGTEFVTIAAGWDHILALTSDGEIFAWDWPDGDYPFDYFSRTVPDGIVFTDDIAAGYKFSLALKAP